ncbi:enoyl-CoA hydratase/isomerase family protein [Rhizorhabdus sp. FW153]|uniref:enoyl-CoA hydratase/isomerase family protein n=1 Tax=Rhizorhabdus sp. FW153 TaxID=3400216 RepID=UPI003CECBF57
MRDEAMIDLERGEDIAWLRLNRPHRLNALTTEMRRELLQTLETVRADPPHVLIVTGNGRGFCAGQDLGERLGQVERGEEIDLRASLADTYNPVIRALGDLPCVTLAAINGVAAGAGIGIALACDMAIMTRSATLALAFGKIGLAPDAGVSWRLARQLGEARALALVLSSAVIGAEQAVAWGLAAQLAEDEVFASDVAALARQLATGSIEAQLATRRLVRDPAAHLDDQLAREAEEQGVLGRTDYFRNRLRSFSAKA